MDKQPILDQIIAKLTEEAASLTAAAKDARSYSTDAEAKAESKYDTQAIESSYLADGQGRMAVEVMQNLEAYKSLILRSYTAGEPIALSALIETELLDARDWYFLGPRSGGLTVEHDGREVLVVTPQSPLGQKLLGRVEGDEVVFAPGRTGRIVRVI